MGKRLREWVTVGCAVVGGILGALGFVTAQNARDAQEQSEIDRLLFEAWDTMGGKHGTTVLPMGRARTQAELEPVKRILDRVLALDADSARCHSFYGAYYALLGKHPQALASQRRAVALEPDEAIYHTRLGVALGRAGKVGEIEAHRKAIALDNTLAMAYGNLGVALKAAGRIDDAIIEYREAIRHAPRYATAHLNLAVALASKGQWTEATRSCRRAISCDGDDPYAHANLAHCLSKSGNIPDAVNSLRRAIELDPQDAYVHHRLGQLLLSQNQIRQAIKEFEETLVLDPDNTDARTSLQTARARLPTD